MKNNISRLILIIFIGTLIIFSFVYSVYNPPEKSQVKDLRIGYLISPDKWVYSSKIPLDNQSFQVCGWLINPGKSPLLFTITDPNDKNKYLHQDIYFFKLKSGNFCINFLVTQEIPSGHYTLWILDGRRSIAHINIEFE